MDKVFIDTELLAEDTFLYSIQMPGFIVMCIAGYEDIAVELEKIVEEK